MIEQFLSIEYVRFYFVLSSSSVMRTGGVCYRVYPCTLLNDKINDNVNAEMARQPLLVSQIQT
jgi:hypothetical protein